MNRIILERDLKKAEAHLREGEQHILHQQAVVKELQSHGHDARQARQLLATFQELLVTHRQDRDRIVQEIAAEDAAGGPLSPRH